VVIINLVTGHEDAERVTVAFLVAGGALDKGEKVTMFLTKEAVRIALPGYAEAIEAAGAPPVSRLFSQFADKGGELLACPVCFDARNLDADALVDNARIGGAAKLWELIGDEPATVFSY
jgi:predicted peroxiredoxin